MAEESLRGKYASLNEVSEAVVRTTGSGSLETSPTQDWLRTHLASADSKKARRIFNMCKLPARDAHSGFEPLAFGRRPTQWHVDHLIPLKNLKKDQAGYEDGNRLRNLAPLLSPYNKTASNTPCSQKLLPGGPYDTSSKQPDTTHPYIEWLVQNQANHKDQLDVQKLLEPNANPPIGDERIASIAQLIADKL